MKNLNYILLITIACTLFACEESIEFDLNNQENSRLVVEGNLTDQAKEHIVKLTRTSSYYENEPAPKETGATISIFDGTVSHTLTETEPGIYKTAPTYQGEIGKTYTLNITTANNDFYSASSTLNSVTYMDTILTTVEDPIKGEGGDDDDLKGQVIALHHYGPEPATLGNNYMWLIDLNGTSLTPTATDVTFVTDEFVNGNYINGFFIHQISEFDPLLQADTLRFTIELHSISREYHDFLLAIVLETEWNGGLFSGPPANIPSNISNGGLGFFRASSVSTMYFEMVNPF